MAAIPGRMTTAALAVLARDRRHDHAPKNATELRAAIEELRSRGYTPRQIAGAIGCAVEAVAQLLEPHRG